MAATTYSCLENIMNRGGTECSRRHLSVNVSKYYCICLLLMSQENNNTRAGDHFVLNRDVGFLVGVGLHTKTVQYLLPSIFVSS